MRHPVYSITGYGHSDMVAAIFFSFCSIFIWVSSANIVINYYLLFNYEFIYEYKALQVGHSRQQNPKLFKFMGDYIQYFFFSIVESLYLPELIYFNLKVLSEEFVFIGSIMKKLVNFTTL